MLDLWTFDFIVRSGRAVLYPVYQGTFERIGQGPAAPGGTARRDRDVQRAKDFFRAVDYLESRPEIDKQKVAYYSLSMGAFPDRSRSRSTRASRWPCSLRVV